MSDIIDRADPVVPDIENEEFKLEIIDEVDESAPDEKTLALEARLAEMEAENARYKEQANAPKGNEQMDIASALAAEMAKLNKPSVEQKPKAEIDYGKLFETVNKNFYSDPSKGIVDVMTPLIQSMDEKYSGTFNKQAATISKLTMLGDPQGSADYVKYKDEIEQLVSTSPPSEQVYSNALKAVRANHFDDIMQEKVAAQIALMTEKAEANIAKANPPLSANFTNATQVQAAHAKKNTGRLTQGQATTAAKWAMNKGYNWSDPEDQEWVVKYLKGEGVI